MWTKHLYVLIHIWSKGEVGVPFNRFKPSSKVFYWRFQGGTSFVDLLCFFSVLCLLCLCKCLFICALGSPAGEGLTSWLLFVVSYCEFVTFPLVSWVVWYLIVSIPDLCTLTYFGTEKYRFWKCAETMYQMFGNKCRHILYKWIQPLTWNIGLNSCWVLKLLSMYFPYSNVNKECLIKNTILTTLR